MSYRDDGRGAFATMLPARVLLVDNDPLFSRRAGALFGPDVELRVASGRDDVMDMADRWRPNIIVVDSVLAEFDAFGLLDELRERRYDSQLSVICLANGPGSQTRFEPSKGDFYGVIRREAGPEGLIAAVRLALWTIFHPVPISP